VPSCLEVKRVYDVCQYIFSGEGEYALGRVLTILSNDSHKFLVPGDLNL
jgi:hypothetical protein